MGGGRFGGNQSPTFDAEFKFAKIQNSHVLWGGGGKGGEGGEGVGEPNFQLLMPSPNLLKKNFLQKFFLSFRAKMCLGMVLDFEYQVVRVYEDANHN